MSYTPSLATISILIMAQQQKALRIVLYIIIIVLTVLACFNLLVLLAAGASSHNVPAKTFKTFDATFIGLTLIDIFAIYQLRRLKKKDKPS